MIMTKNNNQQRFFSRNHTKFKKKNTKKNICTRGINKSHEARNYKDTWNKHRPWCKKLQTCQAGKHELNIGQKAKDIINISCRKIHKTNIGYEARNYKHLMSGKYRKQTSAMRQEITNISCREIHETNIGHEARNSTHLMPEKYRKQTSAMMQEMKNIPCGKHNLNNCHEIRRDSMQCGGQQELKQN